MFTALNVIDGARGLDGSFTPQNHPNRVCLEFLIRFQRRMAGKILQVEKEAISSEISFSLPLATFSDGVQLITAAGPPVVWLEYDRLHGFELEDDNGDRAPLPVVPFKDRFTADRTLYGWLRQRVLFLAGDAQDWTGWSSVVCTYAPTPSGTMLTATELILPDNSFDAVVLALGAELAKRMPDKVTRKTLPGEAEDAEVDYLNLLEERDDTTVGTVRRVFSL